MFEDENKRFMTNRIYGEVSPEIIDHLWWMIDELRKTVDDALELSHINFRYLCMKLFSKFTTSTYLLVEE